VSVASIKKIRSRIVLSLLSIEEMWAVTVVSVAAIASIEGM